MKFDLLIPVVLCVCMIFAIGKAVVSLFTRGDRAAQRPQMNSAEEIRVTGIVIPNDDQPRCICGDIATEPMPILTRNRGRFDFFRRYFAAPPRYVRRIDPYAPLSLCRAHAHVADAKMEEFLFNRVRGILSEANAKVAVEAASFEREFLMKGLADALTDSEKKTARKLQNGKGNVFSLPQVTNGDSREISS